MGLHVIEGSYESSRTCSVHRLYSLGLIGLVSVIQFYYFKRKKYF